MAVKDVEMKDFAFNPKEVVVEVGDTVRWTNNDGARHDAKRDDAPTFNTGLLDPGVSAEVVFTEASDAVGFSYYCTPHASFMTGKVIVMLPGSHAATYTREAALKKMHEKSSKNE